MQSQLLDSQPRSRSVVACEASGRTRTYRLSPTSAARPAAYRRLAVAILGLDVPHLVLQLQAARDDGLPQAA